MDGARPHQFLVFISLGALNPLWDRAQSDSNGSCGALRTKEQDEHEGSQNIAREKSRLSLPCLPCYNHCGIFEHSSVA